MAMQLAAVEDSLLGRPRAALLFESSVVSVLQQLGDLPLDVGRVLGGGLLEYRHEVHNLSREELLVELVEERDVPQKKKQYR